MVRDAIPARTGGISLLTTGRPDLVEALDPSTLSKASSGWAEAQTRCGPWSLETTPDGHQWHRAQGCSFEQQVIVCGPCTSSLDVAFWLCREQSINPWAAVLAISQSSGRGQYKRTWHSPAGNLYATWYWPTLPPPLANLLPLIVGLALAEGLEARGIELKIKWPNDLIVAGRKVGGILVEQRGGYGLVGIGINLAWAPDDSLLRLDGGMPATKLSDHSIEDDPLALWLNMADTARSVVERIVSRGDAAQVVREVESRLLGLGEEVLIRRPGGDEPDFHATLLGLQPDGAVRIIRGDQESAIYSADVLPIGKL